MSDDDYAADSPFDGLDDYYFWDDGASQDVADDLAEHTMPSPVYLEDPAYEMMGGYSDWEYYSDDYYDDDPDILKHNPQAGSPPATLKLRGQRTSSPTSQKRGRKRKLAHTDEIPMLSLGNPGLVDIVQNIGQNITGTIWKIEKSRSEKLYHQGEAKRVALLKDWRSVFRESQPKSDRRSKGMSNKKSALQDEWANDLGLADMGLMTAKGKHNATDEVDNDYEKDDGDSGDDDNDERLDWEFEEQFEHAPVDLDETDISISLLGKKQQDLDRTKPTNLVSPSREQNLISRKRKLGKEEQPGLVDPEDNSDDELKLAEYVFSASKRMRRGSVSSAPTSTTLNSDATTSFGAPEPQSNGANKRGRGRPKKQINQHPEFEFVSTENEKNDTAVLANVPAPVNKKRKAIDKQSAQNEDDSTDRDQSCGEAVVTASRRAKRITSVKVGARNDDTDQPVTQLPKSTTRGSRMKKK